MCSEIIFLSLYLLTRSQLLLSLSYRYLFISLSDVCLCVCLCVAKIQKKRKEEKTTKKGKHKIKLKKKKDDVYIPIYVRSRTYWCLYVCIKPIHCVRCSCKWKENTTDQRPLSLSLPTWQQQTKNNNNVNKKRSKYVCMNVVYSNVDTY